MEILFFEESFFLRQGLWPQIGSWTLTIVSIVAFTWASYHYRKEKVLRNIALAGAATILVLVTALNAVGTYYQHVSCMYDVQLNGDDVPEGYTITQERGEITQIKKYMNKEEYQQYTCKMEGY